MARIKLLPDSVANQIAAGEVVNRPASVVKELMENAVDAGAESITVNFRDGGRELIQIKDDGCGMSSQDARMAFERHATSKIASVDDIYSLATFGFRGEALASIAAVAQVEMHTRQDGAELGTRLNIDGGNFAGQSAVAAPRGTQIWIRNLFYNVPARKKFLDKGSTESTHIITEFQRVALAHPEIAFQLWKDDAPVYNLPAGGLHQRVVGIAGKGSVPKFLEVGVTTSLARVSGFVGRPSAARQRQKEQFLFVNGRFFKSPFFHKAVVQAYEKLIPQAVQPPYFLYLEIDPEEIDVNVHPQKTEVKFTNSSAVWQIINAAVRETLAKSGAVPMMDFDDEERLEIPVSPGHAGFGKYGGLGESAGFGESAGLGDGAGLGNGVGFGESVDYTAPLREPAQVRERDYNPFTQYEEGVVPREPQELHGAWDLPGARELRELRGLEGSRDLQDLRGLSEQGVLSGTGEEAVSFIDPRGDGMPPVYGASEFEYIASEGVASQGILEVGDDAPKSFSAPTNIGEGYATALYGGGVVAIDLRRAREAVLFDRFVAMLRGGHSASQQLLFPERMATSADDAELLRDHAGEFAALGFDIREAGPHAFEIYGTPADMPPEALDEVVYGILDELRDGTFAGEDARRQRLAAVMARTGAGTSAQAARLSQAEVGSLLQALASTANPSFTPQGRPVMARITIEEIKNKLK